MKIGIYLEGSPEMGGGFFQSLKASLLLFDIQKYNSKIELILTNKETKEYLSKKEIKNKLFQLSKISAYISQLFEISSFNDFFNKAKINHPFYKFIKKNNYDLIVFLGPSPMSKFCKDVGFISNIWDLDHKKNSQFPEHNLNNNYENKEKLIKEIITRAFKIIVPHKSNKDDLINFYKASHDKVCIQNFIPMLPTIYKKKLNVADYDEIYLKFKLPSNKKIIFYPAQFWAHKNHKYIVDVAKILKSNKNNKYLFVFCGGNKGNFQYIKELILTNQLEDYIKIFNFLSDDEVISIYKNCNAVVMPTFCGPTNLPIYESFFFKKIIFYTKNLIPDDNINDHLIPIDISFPNDLYKKLEICLDKEKLEKIVTKNYEYYKLVCNEDNFKMNYEKILNEFSYLIDRWK
jgi:glycosyltransferase involved in cell wall biosynthesis